MTTEIKSYIDRFTDDVTERISANPDKYVITGRDPEIQKVITSLTRLTKNSPVLLGEPGVGKTAVVEGFAKEILQTDTLATFANVHVVSLNIAALVGEHFTEYIDALIHELSEKRDDYILFIDELHMIMGAGDSNGSLDAGNILKPALARGDFRVIGATTLDEYHEFIEKDGALERRFQPIMVDEPSIDQTIYILNKMKPRFEKFYSIKVESDAIKSAVEKSVRYINDRFLPDKAIDLLDGASARIKLAKQDVLTADDILKELEIITGIPTSSLTKTSAERGLALRSVLSRRVLGQQRAINSVARAIRRTLVNHNDYGKPLASLLFMGPTGVGKTELAKATAEALFDDENKMIRFDMSEFNQESSGTVFADRAARQIKDNPYTVVLLDEIEKAHSAVFDLMLQIMQDGILTDSTGKTRSFKNALIIMTSNLGYKLINQQNELVGLTHDDFGHSDKSFMNNVSTELKNSFRPEFVNRLDEIVVFNQLDREDIKHITELKLSQYQAMIQRENGWELDYADDLVDYISNEGFDPANGARPIARAINLKLDDPIATLMLKEQQIAPNVAHQITITVEEPEKRSERFDNRTLAFYLNVLEHESA
ncbi:MAG: ATP-dependent Clp protease ATP-binding subunit [Lactobacillaceae bacterium]|jgi:ATP-dependent Clp protease ATP-binding subunit ClpC|nr:ATP-dependent Clp protease ATP-binding subunit [Lactobacillaceae bacterium]